ncbi:hypothetical protein [Bradyrhizobium elkanii]
MFNRRKIIDSKSTAEEIEAALQHPLLSKKEYDVLLLHEMVIAAASVGYDGKGGGGFCGYIENNVGEMTDKTLKELFERFPEGDALSNVWDEIRWRAKERLSKMS